MRIWGTLLILLLIVGCIEEGSYSRVSPTKAPETTSAPTSDQPIIYCDSYDGKMPMPDNISNICVCREGYDKIFRFAGAFCIEHYEDSMKPCDNHSDCTLPEEICSADIGSDDFRCMRREFGCYSFPVDKNEIVSLCVD